MATWTKAGETWNTTAGTKTVVATPALNDLIAVVAGASDMVAGDTITVSDNNSGGAGTYVRVGTASGGGTVGRVDIWVRTALIASATSTTFTATITGDTGGGLTVMRLSGMTWTGYSAVRQVATESTQTENPPSIAFAGATLTGNAILLGLFGEDNPITLTPPTSFVEDTDTGYATPTSGVHVCHLNSGGTSSSYAYSGGAVTDHCEVGVEFDTTSFAATTHGAAMRDQLARTSGMIGILRK